MYVTYILFMFDKIFVKLKLLLDFSELLCIQNKFQILYFLILEISVSYFKCLNMLTLVCT